MKEPTMRNLFETLLERGIFASRWFMAPVYVVLAISLGFIAVKVVQEFIHIVPLMIDMNIKSLNNPFFSYQIKIGNKKKVIEIKLKEYVPIIDNICNELI